ncbi:cytochrome P450 [Artomyces pyxidatus]|uniref:Cytochrome P450 n=1 Tax=Artomyces pyxidatus TaxID=48021 RepID=A0ACB8TEZ5_9AGAM|nr:cytochrome P450 [Artomyces pyxidatus]
MSGHFPLSTHSLSSVVYNFVPPSINADVYGPVAATLIALLIVQYLTSPWRKLPPGPRGWPLVGNAFSIGKAQWLTYTDWKRQYGDVVYFTAFGQPMIILNTLKAARDLFDRRAVIYSDRPNLIVAGDILCGGLIVAFQHYGPLWRRMRKATHEGLNRGIPGPFRPAQVREAVILTLSMLDQPAAWDQHMRRSASSMIMSVTYDTPPIESQDDPRLKDVFDFAARITEAFLPGRYFVELLPWMKHIPSRFAKWKREAEQEHAKLTKVFENLYNNVGTDLANGIDRPSVSAKLLKDTTRNNLSVQENAWIAAVMYVAGSETTSAALAWWLLAVVTHPEAQRRAQTELDAVVGRGRLPTFADLPHLPYVSAMVKETLRWRTLDPLGVPHRSTEDDWYEGMFIPKGTVCIANVWAVHRDAALYGPDAHEFNPDRFLDENGVLNTGPPDTKEDGHVAYGFGRRICSGKHIANDSLFIDIALMLWACKFEPARDERGDAIPIDIDGWVDCGAAVHPAPFSCSVTSRFPEACTLLEMERELSAGDSERK